MGSDELRDAAWKAEDEGREVYIQEHEEYPVVEYIEIDGVETYNLDYIDEVKDAYWAEDSNKLADHYWRN